MGPTNSEYVRIKQVYPCLQWSQRLELPRTSDISNFHEFQEVVREVGFDVAQRMCMMMDNQTAF